MRAKGGRHPRLWTSTINLLALASLLVVVGRTSLLAVAEPFPWMSEVGELAYDLSLALLTGWLLNWLLLERPRHRAQIAMYEVVGPRIQSLGGVGRAIAQAFAQHLGTPLADPDTGPTDAEWKRICSALSFETPLSNVIKPAGQGVFAPQSVLGLLLHEFERADRSVAQVQQAAFYFDVDLNALIHLEQTDPLRQMVTRHASILTGSLDNLAGMLIDYDHKGRDISAYYEEHIRPHTSNRLPGP